LANNSPLKLVGGHLHSRVYNVTSEFVETQFLEIGYDDLLDPLLDLERRILKQLLDDVVAELRETQTLSNLHHLLEDRRQALWLRYGDHLLDDSTSEGALHQSLHLPPNALLHPLCHLTLS
jgi:hypothetical protein